MPETSVDYRLGQLDASVRALIAEVRESRNEIRETMAQHDKRDDERFESHGVRLAAIEQKIARADWAADASGRRWHGWGALIVSGISSAAAMLGLQSLIGMWHR